MKNSSHNVARDIAFKRLFKYITGENKDGMLFSFTCLFLYLGHFMSFECDTYRIDVKQYSNARA